MNTVLLANLIKIRWIAIVGQLITLFTIFFVFNFTIPLTECLFVVLLSILVNFSSSFIQRGNSTLTDKKTFLFLLFDISQLVGLLFLTGGVFNPFVVLIVAPIIISASYLSALWTILLSLYSILLILICTRNFTYDADDLQYFNYKLYQDPKRISGSNQDPRSKLKSRI